MEKKICPYCHNELKDNEVSCPKCLTAFTEKDSSEKDKKVVLYKRKGNYLTGIIGGLLGGFIASIPWFIIEVFTSIISAYLAFVIAYGVSYGYKLFNGKLDKVYPNVVRIIPFIVVLVLEFVFIPMYFFNQQNIEYSFEYVLEIMMQGEQLLWLGITLLFTFLGTKEIVKKAFSEIIE